LSESSRTLDELPRWARELLEIAPVAHLGLVDDGDQPRVLPVTFVLHDEALWSALDHKPKRMRPEDLARVRYLRRRPEAALTVDRYDEDWEQLAWVQVLVRVEVLEAGAAGPARAALAAKYEPYRDQPPDGPLLRMAPRRFLWWHARGEAGRPRAST
jgi:PPOX class probable F420-dependent enzyme